MTAAMVAFILMPPPALPPQPLDAWRWERERSAQWRKVLAPVRRWVWNAIRGWWRCDVAEQVVYGGVSREKLEKARSRILEAAGFSVPGDAGFAKHGGFEVTYSYNEPACELTLILERKPRFVPVWAIKRKLKAELDKEGIYEVRT